MEAERLARIMHNASRKAIDDKLVLVHLGKGFIEFDDLPENVKKGRILTAKEVLKKVMVIPISRNHDVGKYYEDEEV